MIAISKVKTKDVANEILGDDKKFAEFIELNKNFMNKIISKVHDINVYGYQELYQEAQLSMWEALQKFDPEKRIKEKKTPGTLSTFAYHVIMNNVRRYLNDENKRMSEESSIEAFKKHTDDTGVSGNGSASGNSDYWEENWKTNQGSMEDEIIDRLDKERTMTHLSEQEKEIFRYRFVEKNPLTHEDIARKLNMNPNTYRAIYYGSFKNKIKKLGYKI